MKHILTSLISLFFLFNPISAQEESIRVEPICGPFVSNITQNSFTVSWVSDKDAMGWVELAPNDGTSMYYKERPQFHDLSGCGIKPLTRTHSVLVYGLKPGTSYRYRIMMKAVQNYHGERDITYGREYGASTNRCPIVTTLPEVHADVINFAVVNDVHAKDSLFRCLFSDKAKNESYDFVVFNGDMSSNIEDIEDMTEGYLASASELFGSSTPIYPVRGNHEYRGGSARKFMDIYSFTDSKPYYTFKYGKYFFIVLDTGEDKPDSDIEYQEMLCTEGYLNYQAQWLKEVVASEDFKNAERRIVFGHIPPALKNQWHGNWNVSNIFIPILNEAGIDLMLCGHNHRYSFFKAGDCGNNFPILVNSNLEKLELRLSPDSIDILITDTNSKQTHKLNL